MRHLLLTLMFSQSIILTFGQTQRVLEFKNGNWFIHDDFQSVTVYSIDGIISFKAPTKIDSTIDLGNKYIIPPFADAHNHNIGTGVEEWDRKAISKFFEAGVFYAKMQGNLPVTDQIKKNYGLNQKEGLDVSFAQGTLTATGAMPIFLIEKILMPQGYNRGYTKEQLRDFRYFIIDSESDIDSKWNKIVGQKPDFIKTFLWQSGEYERLKNDTSVFFKGINPALLKHIVKRAHSESLKVSVHVTNSRDFHNAVISGVDEISHLPRFASGAPNQPIDEEDAKLAAKNGIVVITTVAASLFQGGIVKPEDRPLAKNGQIKDLKTLFDNGVTIAIGSDDVAEYSTIKEILYLKELGVFDNKTLLRICTEITPKTIFPKRKIGLLAEGYEATFLALDGNPIENFENIKNINLRFKQGNFIK
jgi:imidazolonepropionase-like amidohydrolase